MTTMKNKLQLLRYDRIERVAIESQEAFRQLSLALYGKPGFEREQQLASAMLQKVANILRKDMIPK